MRETTSFRLKACNIAASEAHNDRTKEMKHVRKDLFELNESYSYIPHSLHTENAIIKREYNANHPKALYKNAVTIKEGCLVMNDNCTMEDVKRFCDECHKRYGIIPLKIHIHRDEGHYDKKTKEWKPNIHAHVTFRMYGHKGEKYKLKPEHTTEMQDLAAQCLHMKRGKKSGKKGLDSIDYKIELREKYLESLDNAIENAESKLSKKGAKAVYEATKEILGGKMKKELDETKEALKKAEKANLDKDYIIETLERDSNARSDTNARLLFKLNQQAEDIKNIEEIRAERDRVIEDYNLKSAELDLKEQSLQKDYKNKEDKLKQEYKSKENILKSKEERLKEREQEREEFYKNAEEIGLTCQEANKLMADERERGFGELVKSHITTSNGTTIVRENPENPDIVIRYGTYTPQGSSKPVKGLHLNFVLRRDWMSVKRWLSEVFHSPWFRIGGRSQDRSNTMKLS